MPLNKVTTLIIDHRTLGDRTSSISQRTSETGTLKSLQVTAIGGSQPRKGQCFVAVGTSSGPFADEKINAILLSGYVTQEDSLGDMFDFPLEEYENVWIQSFADAVYSLRVVGRIQKAV